MAAMGFSHDPGPLPFATIRDAKWANRLVEVPMPMRIHGEHGCVMPRQIASVVRVEHCERGAAAHIYPDNRPLVRVCLEKPVPCARVHAFDGEWGMCAHCGEPNPTSQGAP